MKIINYAKEGFLLLAQSLLLSCRKTAELKWCRTINTHGCPSKNIPVDLHMEHLNRRLKGMMWNLGLNITPESACTVCFEGTWCCYRYMLQF